MLVNDRTMALLEQALDFRASRHTVLLSNVSNEETPGYKPKDLQFQHVLKQVAGARSALPMVATTPGHLGGALGSAPQAFVAEVVSAGQVTTIDGNRVNIEMEMAKIASNTGKYGVITQILTQKFRMMLSAIREGR